MGDPAGVGPEVCLDLLQDPEISELCIPIIFGDSSVLQACAKQTSKPLQVGQISGDQIAGTIEHGVHDLGLIHVNDLVPGTVNAQTGRATYGYVASAIDTEIFAERTKTENFCMAFISDTISCSLVTVHVGYNEVPSLLTTDRIYEVISLTRQAHQKLLGKEPRLAVCGLNPHAGENGLFGNREEETIIVPAIEKARGEGADIIGPLPPDTAFTQMRRESMDAYICMYHDQALIPVKALAFDQAVNVTLGLPIVRTSVDHGTALDIAWQGKADPSSLKAAVRLAARMV